MDAAGSDKSDRSESADAEPAAPEAAGLTEAALASVERKPMPELGARHTRSRRSKSRDGRRKARLRQRVTLAALVVLIGASLGVLAAWWSRRDAAVPNEASADAAAPTAAAVAATTPPPASPAAGQRMPNAAVQQLDTAELLRDRTVAAGNWRLARLRGSPQVMVLEFPNLAEQGAAMNRIAALIEKAGAPRDRVLNDGELHMLITGAGDNAETFYQGHDYVAEHIARFYTLAEKQGQAMNVHESKLRQLLLDKKVIEREDARYTAQGLQAIVTFTAPQPDDPRTPQNEAVDDRRRESVLMHELSHGLYFTSREYRDHCWRFWRERMTEDERRLMRRLLSRMNYDPHNEDLLVNEMQALLMHTPDTRAFGASVLGVSEAQLADMRKRFRKDMPVR